MGQNNHFYYASVPTGLECVASIKMYLYLQNILKLVSVNLGNLFLLTDQIAQLVVDTYIFWLIY